MYSNKSTNKYNRLVGILLLLSLLVPSWATSVADVLLADDQYLSFKHITTDDNLLHMQVRTIGQDQNSNIWIGTRYGLNKYDGYSVETYVNNLSDANSLSSAIINQVLVDSSNRLWVGTHDGGLNRYLFDKDQFVHYPDFKQVYTLYQDADHNIWVAAEASGLAMYDASSDSFRSYALSNSEISIRSICELDARRLLLGTRQDGLFIFDKLTKKFSSNSIVLNGVDSKRVEILDIALFAQRVFLATNQGMWCAPLDDLCTTTDVSFVPCFDHVLPISLNKASVYDDTMWVATKEGLFRIKYDEQTCRFSYSQYRHSDNDLNSLSNNVVNDVFVDRNNMLWVATSTGVSYCDLYALQVENVMAHPLLNTVVNVVLENSYDDLWIGLQNGKLCRYDPKEKKITVQNRSFKGSIDCIIEDQWQNIWVGNWQDGLTRFSLDDEGRFPRSIGRYHTQSALRLPSNNATSLALYKDKLYVGTYGNGIAVIDFDDNGSVKSIKSLKVKLLSNVINNIYTDTIEHCLWISTPNGLNKLVDEQVFSYTAEDGYLSHNFVWEVLRTSPTHLWVGTIYDGLNLLTYNPKTRHPSALTTFRKTNGLQSNSIQSIEYDSLNNVLWVGANGMSKLDIATGDVLNYNANDGFNGSFYRVSASSQLSNGDLCFGSNQGVSIIKNEVLEKNRYAPTVEISALYLHSKEVRVTESDLLDRPIDQLSELRLDYSNNYIGFNIKVLHFTNPQNNKYKYMLEGVDKTWVESDSHQQHINYTSLSHGTYRLRILAANRDGVWSTHEKQLTIRILPPWWLTWYAYLSYVILFLLVVYLSYRSVIRRKELKQQSELEKVRLEKQEELTMMKIRFFTNISHELRTPLTLIIDPLESMLSGDNPKNNNYYLNIMHQNAERLMTLFNQLLDFRKIETANMKLHTEPYDVVSFFKTIAESFTYSVRQKDISYAYSANFDKYETWIDKDCVEKILFNLLSNSLKNTRSGYIETELEILPAQKQFRIIVSDSGVGISEKEQAKIFEDFYQSVHSQKRGTGIGLFLVQNLVSMHYGTIDLTSKEGEGTSFIVTLPLGDDFMKIDERVVVESTLTVDQDTPEQSEEKKTIFIAEDNAELREYLINELKATYNIYYAEDGLQAYDMIQKCKPNLVITDIMMPGMNGLDLAKKLKGHARTSFIPIIMLTAKASDFDHLEGIKHGGDVYLTKPFKLSILKGHIKSLIHHANSLKLFYSAQKSADDLEVDIEQNSFVDQATKVVQGLMDNEMLDSQLFATHMSMAYSTLYNKLKKYTGYSVTGFIRMVRVKEAARLIANTTLSVNEIIFRVGFNDPKYFRECFKRDYGITPSEYMKKYRHMSPNE